MNLLEQLADAFYRTFGITEPSALRRRRAALYFLLLLLLIPSAIALLAWTLSVSLLH